MRILTITTSYPRHVQDMAGHFVARSCEALARLGHRVTALCPHEPGLPLDEVADGVRVIRFRYSPWQGLERVAYGSGIPDNLQKSWLARAMLPGFAFSLRRHACREAARAEVIHAHWAPCAVLARQAARRFGLPLVLTLHGSDTIGTGRLSGWVLRRACAGSDRVLAVSPAVAAVAARFSSRVIELANGMRLPTAGARLAKAEARKKLGLDPATFQIITVGRLAPVKNHGFLLRAFARMVHGMSADLSWMAGANQRYPDLMQVQHELAENLQARGFVTRLLREIRRSRLIIVGDGSERGRLEAEARDLEIADRVRFVGSVAMADVDTWLAASDMFLLASRREGRPLALLEAMAAGLPCAAARVEGVADVMQHAVSGLYFEPESFPGFAAAVGHCLVNPGLAAGLGEEARKRVAATCMGWPEHAARLVDVYAEAIADKS